MFNTRKTAGAISVLLATSLLCGGCTDSGAVDSNASNVNIGRLPPTEEFSATDSSRLAADVTLVARAMAAMLVGLPFADETFSGKAGDPVSVKIGHYTVTRSFENNGLVMRFIDDNPPPGANPDHGALFLHIPIDANNTVVADIGTDGAAPGNAPFFGIVGGSARLTLDPQTHEIKRFSVQGLHIDSPVTEARIEENFFYGGDFSVDSQDILRGELFVTQPGAGVLGSAVQRGFLISTNLHNPANVGAFNNGTSAFFSIAFSVFGNVGDLVINPDLNGGGQITQPTGSQPVAPNAPSAGNIPGTPTTPVQPIFQAGADITYTVQDGVFQVVIPDGGGGHTVIALRDLEHGPISALGTQQIALPANATLHVVFRPGVSANLSQDAVTVPSGSEFLTFVRALDPNGHPVPFTTTRSTWSATGAAVSLLSQGKFRAQTPGQAIVTYTDLNSQRSGDGTVTVVAGNTPTRLEVSGVGNGQVGHTLGSLAVQLEDSQGAHLSNNGVAVQASLVNPNGAVLGGVVQVNSVNGVATFSNLTIDKAGFYQLRFQISGGPAVNSAGFVVSPATGQATTVIFRSQPATTQTAGVAVSAEGGGGIKAGLADNSFTPQAVPNVPVTIHLNGPQTGHLQGDSGGTTVTLTTDANGQVTFSNLLLSGSGSGFTFGVDAAGLTGSTSQSFALSAGGGLPPGTRQGYLFVGDFGHGAADNTVVDNVRVVKYNPATGVMSSGDQKTLENNAHPTHITITRDKRFVMVVGNQSNKVYVYSFNSATGTMSLLNTYTGATAPYQILQSPSTDTRFYLTNQGPIGQSGFVTQLDFTPGTGTLTKFSTDLIAGGGASGIAGFFKNNGFDYLYVANTVDNSVTAMRVNFSTGAADLLNSGLTQANPSEILLEENTSNGRQIFVSNRGTSTITQFRLSDAIDQQGNPPASGALQGIDQSGNLISTLETQATGRHYNVGANPRGLAIASGTFPKKFLYSANAGTHVASTDNLSGFLAAGIDASNPPLTHALDDTDPTHPGTAIDTGGNAPTGAVVVVGKDPNLGPQAIQPQFLYVTNRNSDNLSGAVVNNQDGSLTPLSDQALAPGDQPFTVTGATFTVP